jgi:hypothetical protein
MLTEVFVMFVAAVGYCWVKERRLKRTGYALDRRA